MMYNKTVQDCFFSPQHAGVIETEHGFVVVCKSAPQGQSGIEFYMQCNEDKIILKASFKTNGNPYLIAGLEWVCRQLEGKLLEQIPAIDYPLLIKELAIPTHQYPIAIRIINVLKEVLNLMNNKLALIG